MNEEKKPENECAYTEECPQFPACDVCNVANTASTMDPFPEDETPEATANAPDNASTTRPPLVVISAAELMAMTEEEIAAGVIPERVRLRNEEASESTDDSTADDDEEEEYDDVQAGFEEAEKLFRERISTMKLRSKLLKKRYIREAETRELTAELRRRKEEEFKPEISKVPLTVEQVKEYINEACGSGYGNIRSQSTLKLLEEIKRRERARIFARKLANGKLTETEAREFFEETRTRIFITADTEPEGTDAISVVIKYDGDCECECGCGKYARQSDLETEILPCAFVPQKSAWAIGIREFQNGKFCVVCSDKYKSIIYTNDFYSTPDEALIEWNALMLRLSNPEQKIHVYDYREMILAKTCDIDTKSDSAMIMEKEMEFLKSAREMRPEIKELSDKYRDRPGMVVWQEAVATNAVFRSIVNAIAIFNSSMAAYEGTKVFDTPSGRYTRAVVMHGTASLKKCAEYLGGMRDSLLCKIYEAWEKANENGTESA